MAFTVVAVTGPFRHPTGAAAEGTVTFTPSVTMRQAATHEIAVRAPIVAPLVAGAISVSLYATDDPGTDVTGCVYQVVERTTLGPERAYSLPVPRLGGAIDLATVVH